MGGNDPRFLAWLMPRVLLVLAWAIPLGLLREAFSRGKKK